MAGVGFAVAELHVDAYKRQSFWKIKHQFITVQQSTNNNHEGKAILEAKYFPCHKST